MLTVALTGGIATGKSIVAAVFRRRGGYLDSADDAARELMRPGEPAWEKIVAHFGREILSPDRTIDRKALAGIIYSDSGHRRFLNDLIHPLVFEKRRETVARLEKEGRVKIYISEAALTIEAGYGKFFDKIVVTSCPEDIQVERLMLRDGIGREAAVLKIRAQMPAEEKEASADYVIDTSGAIEETLARAERTYTFLLEDYENKKRRA
jgi:dephospho-CoA kinase